MMSSLWVLKPIVLLSGQVQFKISNGFKIPIKIFVQLIKVLIIKWNKLMIIDIDDLKFIYSWIKISSEGLL